MAESLGFSILLSRFKDCRGPHDNFNAVVLPHSDAGVGGAEVDSNGCFLCHFVEFESDEKHLVWPSKRYSLNPRSGHASCTLSNHRYISAEFRGQLHARLGQDITGACYLNQSY